MRKIYLLFILLVSSFSFAQNAQIGNYSVSLNIETISEASGVGWSGNCGSTLKSWLKFSDNTNAFYFHQAVGDGENLPNDWTAEFSSAKVLNQLVFDSDARLWHGGFNRGCKSDNTQYGLAKNINYGVSEYYTNDNFTSTYKLRATLKILPKLKIAGDLLDRFLPTADKVNIESDKGFLYSEYNWQYSFDLINWIKLPQYNGSSKISVQANDILGLDSDKHVGEIIYLQQTAYGGESKSIQARFKILKSAPHIVSTIPSLTQCFDSTEGSIKIIFDRPLIDGEQLSISFLKNNSVYDITSFASDNSYTIQNIQKGEDSYNLFGFYKANLYIGAPKHRDTFTVKSPSPLDFTLSSSNILCNGSDNGTITITPTGGTNDGHADNYYSLDNGTTWVPFFNGKPSHTIENLKPGTYNIKIKDMNGCIARDQKIVNGVIALGEEKILTKTIAQPENPITLTYHLATQPTFKGGSNGKITASVTGGTPISGNSYSLVWKDSLGKELNSNKSTTQFSNGTYAITLNNIPAGTYTLNVSDSNYNNATDKTGCTLVPTLTVPLSEPPALVAKIKVERTISCNSTNQFGNDDDFNPQDGQRDESQDATLVADVDGGVPYAGGENGGLPYQYIWSKLNTISNQWEVLNNVTGIKAENLSKGTYSLNVIDKNGITQGTYINNVLATANPATQQIVEPTKLELTFDSGNVSCHAGNNGWATAKVSGGTPKADGSYTYEWYNVEGGIIDKDKLTGLTLGTYSVTVTDSKGCIIQGKITIEEPQTAVALKYKENETVSPTFHGATNGKIVAEVTGGTPNTTGDAYSYKWTNKKGDIQAATAQIVNGIYTITLNGIPADDYFLTVWDKNYNTTTNQVANCSIINSKVSLSEPDPLVVTFEIKQTISCNVSNEFGNDKDTTPSDGQRDESQDGILIAHVKGGTPLTPTANNGLSYYFYWKKQQADGTWITWNENDETAENLSHGNYALNVKDRNGIMLGTYTNNTLVTPIDVTQFMQEPPKLEVTFTKGDVFCKGGNDGWATANVTGGTAPYEYEWSNGETISENTFLKVGTYSVKIIDAKGCATQGNIEIKEPLAPITLDYTEVTNPSFYKATNGKIVVDVKGGTIFPDNTYWYQWKNSKGITLTTTTAQFNNGIYTITLTGLPDDTYTLTIRDANYNTATNKIGCTIINSSTTLEQPDPLVVTFEILRTISCNVSNTFGDESDTNPSDGQRDESQDGILITHVTGGILLDADKNNGLPYFYTWKKQLADGSWVLWNDQDETAENISHGTYALNIEDANGIKLGTYVNNVLTKEIDVTQFMPEPSKLGLTFTKLDVGCTTGNDGWAEAIVTGGTAPYTYQWTNEATTARIDNLTANNYFVIVTDAKGCIIQGSIFVGDPNGVFTTEEIKNPTCYQGNDGAINLEVTGGNLPYQYLWNTGATTKDINNLVAGNYEVTITCPDCCVYRKSFILKDPNPIVVNIGSDRTLCNDQSLDLDASIADPNAQYSWTATNGFKSNSPTINVTKAGTYHVKVTSALGCIGEDSIEITTNKVAISSEFLVSSQAYLDEEVILVNTSDPFGENTQWIIPNGAAIVDEKEKFITLRFNAIGTYTIGLKQTQGDCYAVYSKNITVEQRSTLPNVATKNAKFITDFIVTPNPSDGNFKAIINMEETSPVNLRLFSYNGQYSLIQKKESGKKNYSIDFNAKLAAGIYVIVLETAQQTLVKKIIIK